MDTTNIPNELSKLTKRWTNEYKWVVTSPTTYTNSVSCICFKTDITNLVLQIVGGLRESDILMITTDESEAKNFAQSIITVLGAKWPWVIVS